MTQMLTRWTLEVETKTDPVKTAIDRTVDYFFRTQRTDGSWQDHLPSSAISTAFTVLALHYADHVRYAGLIEGGCRWLRETQHPDGGWGDAIIDPSNFKSTGLAAGALQIADRDRSREAIARSFAFFEYMGGFERLADRKYCSLAAFTTTFMALGGLYPWEKVQRLPLELIFMPKKIRSKISFTVPAILAFGLLHAQKKRTSWLRRRINRAATPRVLAWLHGIQAHDGGCEESMLLVACISIGLNQGRVHQSGIGKQIGDRCLTYLVQHCRPDGSWPINRDLEFSATNYVLMGLEASGYLDDPRLRPTVAWMLQSQHIQPFYATNVPRGGWGWSVPSGWPDTDDTSMAVTTLRRMGLPASNPQLRLGCDWLLAMQGRNGSWGCFVKDSMVAMDEPCPGFTAHAVIGLAGMGYTVEHPTVRRVLDYFRRVQQPDGAFHSVWFRNYVAGTAGVLDAYATIGLDTDPVARRCIAWLLANQNDDGSWGGVRWMAGTVEETAWALAALIAAGTPANDPRLARAADWLVAQQHDDGSWEPSVLGRYQLDMMYSDDHIANGSALQALARYWRRRNDPSTPFSQLIGVQGTRET